jgi:menaquinone-specific isochorismate synthase
MTQSPNSIINPEWLLEWLKNGAFCQRPAFSDGQRGQDRAIYLFLGPFAACDSGWDPDLSVQDFFGSAQDFRVRDKSPHVISSSELIARLKRLQSVHPFPDSSEGPLIREDFQAPDYENYQIVFQSIQSAMRAGNLKKAVPVALSSAGKCPSLAQRCDWILRLLESPQDMHPYGFWTLHTGMLGLTPEILLHRTGSQVETAAVAGTLSKASSQSVEQFLSDAKERSEHDFVVQDLVQQMRPFGHVTIGETVVREYPTLYHLVTPIQLSVNHADWTVAELTKNLHPTSALGVFPREIGLSFLEKLPQQKLRMKHGAPLSFYLSKTESLVLVAIRCLQWNETGSFIVSGGGLGMESQLENEWREILHKRNAVFNFLGMTDERNIHPHSSERFF